MADFGEAMADEVGTNKKNNTPSRAGKVLVFCFEEHALIKFLLCLKEKEAKDLLLRRGLLGLRFEFFGFAF